LLKCTFTLPFLKISNEKTAKVQLPLILADKFLMSNNKKTQSGISSFPLFLGEKYNFGLVVTTTILIGNFGAPFRLQRFLQFFRVADFLRLADCGLAEP